MVADHLLGQGSGHEVVEVWSRMECFHLAKVGGTMLGSWSASGLARAKIWDGLNWEVSGVLKVGDVRWQLVAVVRVPGAFVQPGQGALCAWSWPLHSCWLTLQPELRGAHSAKVGNAWDGSWQQWWGRGAPGAFMFGWGRGHCVLSPSPHLHNYPPTLPSLPVWCPTIGMNWYELRQWDWIWIGGHVDCWHSWAWLGGVITECQWCWVIWHLSYVPFFCLATLW